MLSISPPALLDPLEMNFKTNPFMLAMWLAKNTYWMGFECLFQQEIPK